MRNPEIIAARSARAEYRQRLKRLEREASQVRAIYAKSLKKLAIDIDRDPSIISRPPIGFLNSEA